MRKPKPPLAAWLVEYRKRLGYKPRELALRLDVAETTIRGWETGRGISQEHIAALEQIFGVHAPEPAMPAGSDLPALLVALERQANLLTTLIGEIRQTRETQAGVAEGMLRAVELIATRLQPLPAAEGRSARPPSSAVRP